MASLNRTVQIRGDLARQYDDVYSDTALDAIAALAELNEPRLDLMRRRIARRAERSRERRRIDFLAPGATIAGTDITVADARAGRFTGSAIPGDLQRQWIQGTGPGAKPDAPLPRSIRNVAYALLSGADGWMFDGEDALGQVTTMSLDNQRNLRLGIARAPEFLAAAEGVAGEMNAWAAGFLKRPIIDDWLAQLDFTTTIFRARGLHLDDRHVRMADGTGLSASIVDAALYVAANHAALRARGASVVLYLPKIQTAEEAAFWHRLLSALEGHLGLATGTVKTYVLVEQLEASYQLMEIRAALGVRFVGFNTGRWDYINSVADAMAWDDRFANPNIDAITMTYGYMHAYEDRVRRAVNTEPDAAGVDGQGGGRRSSGARAAWCTSPAPARSISSDGTSRRSPIPKRSPTGCWSWSPRRARSAARATSWRRAVRQRLDGHFGEAVAGRTRSASSRPAPPRRICGSPTGRCSCTSCGRCGSAPARSISSDGTSRREPLTYTKRTPTGCWRWRCSMKHPKAEYAPRTTGPRRANDLGLERRPAVRKPRLRPGHASAVAGGPEGTGRPGLLRGRRRAVPDGGHAPPLRDPPEHPVGVAAQGCGADRWRRRRPRNGRSVAEWECGGPIRIDMSTVLNNLPWMLRCRWERAFGWTPPGTTRFDAALFLARLLDEECHAKLLAVIGPTLPTETARGLEDHHAEYDRY